MNLDQIDFGIGIAFQQVLAIQRPLDHLERCDSAAGIPWWEWSYSVSIRQLIPDLISSEWNHVWLTRCMADFSNSLGFLQSCVTRSSSSSLSMWISRTRMISFHAAEIAGWASGSLPSSADSNSNSPEVATVNTVSWWILPSCPRRESSTTMMEMIGTRQFHKSPWSKTEGLSGSRHSWWWCTYIFITDRSTHK